MSFFAENQFRAIGDANAETERLRGQVADLLGVLRKVEAALTKTPAFNAWDLGPSDLLLEVRRALEGHR